jgi:hypothetical protein
MGDVSVWRWQAAVGLAAVGQLAAGLVFFVGTPLRDAAPFGLALGGGTGLLSVAALRGRGLARVAVAANVLLAGMAFLGAVPVAIGLATGAAEPRLAWNALGALALAAASAGSAAGLRRVWRRQPRPPAEPAHAPDAGRGIG